MLYTIILTHADGTTATHTHTAETMKEAHEHGATLRTAETDTLRVYATTTDEHGEILVDGLQAGALTVVKSLQRIEQTFESLPKYQPLRYCYANSIY